MAVTPGPLETVQLRGLRGWRGLLDQHHRPLLSLKKGRSGSHPVSLCGPNPQEQSPKGGNACVHQQLCDGMGLRSFFPLCFFVFLKSW